jgi:hypothetical protein
MTHIGNRFISRQIYISTGIVPTKVPLWKNNEEKFIDSCFIEADLTQGKL